MPFFDWLPTAKIPPRILRSWGGVWTNVVALLFDAMAESARQAVKVRFPSMAPPDGLREIGLERQEARATAFVYEDDVAFAERLRTAWSRRRRSGTKAGLVRVFEVFGFASFTVYDKREWFPSKVWHAWIFLPKASHPWGPGPVCGDSSTCGDGSTCGTSMRVGEVRNIREVTASWIPPNTRTFLILQTEDGPVCGDGSLCDDDTICGGNSEHLRLGKATLS